MGVPGQVAHTANSSTQEAEEVHCCEFEASQCYLESSRTAWAMLSTVSNDQNQDERERKEQLTAQEYGFIGVGRQRCLK